MSPTDLVIVRLHSRVFRLDPSNLLFNGDGCYSGALVIWGLSMTPARFRLASILVVVARWFTDLDVIFIIFYVCCTAMIEDE